jgi:hypothetical protein
MPPLATGQMGASVRRLPFRLANRITDHLAVVRRLDLECDDIDELAWEMGELLNGDGLLDGRFQAVVSAEDVEHPKPAPDIYLEACRRLGFEPGRCAALEDSPTGVTAAVAAGMYVIGVPYFTGTQLPGCDLLAPSLADPAVARALGLA